MPDTQTAPAGPTEDAATRGTQMALELLALDINLRKEGHTLVSLLALQARHAYGVDVLPTADDLASLDPSAPDDAEGEAVTKEG